VSRDGVLSEVELGPIVDSLLALVDVDEIAFLSGWTERDVPRAVIVEILRMVFPDPYALGHELGHRRLEVVIANDSAGDARGPCRYSRLVHDQDVIAATLAARFQAPGEVPSGREPVDARSDHEEADGAGKHAARALTVVGRHLLG